MWFDHFTFYVLAHFSIYITSEPHTHTSMLGKGTPRTLNWSRSVGQSSKLELFIHWLLSLCQMQRPHPNTVSECLCPYLVFLSYHTKYSFMIYRDTKGLVLLTTFVFLSSIIIQYEYTWAATLWVGETPSWGYSPALISTRMIINRTTVLSGELFLTLCSLRKHNTAQSRWVPSCKLSLRIFVEK